MKTNLPRLCRLLVALLLSQIASRAQLVSVNSITNNADVVGVFFGQPLTLPSATNPANYTVYTKTGAVSVVSVDLQTNGQYVALNLAAKIGEFFAVSVSNVVDVAANTNNASTIGFISDYDSRDVGTTGDPSPTGRVYTAHSDTFEVTVGGSDVGGTNDHFHFIYQQVISNFDMAVMVTRLDAANDLSKAGLMARESLNANSRTIQTYFTPTAGSNEVEVAVRSATGGTTTDAGFQIGPRASASSNSWLRLTRTNNAFTAYYGTNGIDWRISGVTTQTFASTLNIGMMVASHTTNGGPTTARFTDFGKLGARPGDGVLPTLNAALVSTNLELTWLRTPRDFAVQVSTNLTDWALLLAPIYIVSSNANQRLMQVPLNLSSNQLFLRLVQVDRVIPDPPLVLTTGTVLSLANNNASRTSQSSLCSINVRDAITQTSMTAVPGYNISFSTATADSGDTLDTVLQVRKGNNVIGVPCDDNGAGIKSVLYFNTDPTPPTTPTTYSTFSLVAAVKQNTPTTPLLQIKVTITLTPK